jgi:hypothetical protein
LRRERHFGVLVFQPRLRHERGSLIKQTKYSTNLGRETAEDYRG